MDWIPKDMAELLTILIDLSDDIAVKADSDTGISSETVEELRALPFWRGGLVVVTPRKGSTEQAIKIRKID